ncbi:MAG TPA: signal peptidase II [Armatimonadota bacterium]|jgi:signal peptidase II
MKRRLLFYILALAVVALDRLTKVWAVQALSGERFVALVPGTLLLNLVHNRGSAFGLLQGGAALLAAAAVVAIGAMVWLERRGLPGRAITVALALLLGGALGNLIDRVTLGYVVDFIELDWHGRNVWPVFNVADSAITVGTCILIIWLWRDKR